MRRLAVSLVLMLPLCGQMPEAPVRAVSDPGVVTTRQSITPAGVQSVFTGRVQGVVFGATSSEIWVLNSGTVFHMDWRAKRGVSPAKAPGAGGFEGSF